MSNSVHGTIKLLNKIFIRRIVGYIIELINEDWVNQVYSQEGVLIWRTVFKKTVWVTEN